MLRVAYDHARNRAVLSMASRTWRSIENERRYSISTHFEDGASYDPADARGIVFDVSGGTEYGVTLAYEGRAFLEHFAASAGVRFMLGDTLLDSFSLAGTRAAVAGLLSCSMRSFRDNPRDPFADLSPAASSGPPDTPAVQTGGSISDADYPAGAKAAQAQGTTRMSFDIDPDGRVGACTVTGSSGNAELDATACALLQRRFRFRPATRDGHPVASSQSRSVTWRLPRD